MRFSAFSSLFVGSVLLTAATAQLPSDPSFDSRNQTIFSALSMNDDTIVVSHHLMMPAFSRCRELLDEKGQIYTAFMPTNKAIRQELQWADEMFCEDGDTTRATGKFRRHAKKQIKEIWGHKVHLTDDDCDNLSNLIELDEKVETEARRLKERYHTDNPHSQRLKAMLRENEVEYRQIRFSPEVEKILLAHCSYVILPGLVDTATIGAGNMKALTTLLSKPELLPLDGLESNTRLVLKKGREGRMKIVFASPRAPFWKARFDEHPIEAVNGLIYVTRHSVPLPHTLSKSLIINKLFLTHALLNYTGLLDKLSERKSLTVIAPTNEGWMKVLPQIMDKSTIRRMAREVRQRYNLIKVLPFYKQIQRQEADLDKMISHSAEGSIEAESIGMSENPEMEIKEAESESEMSAGGSSFESTQTRRLFSLSKRGLRSLLLSHILPGVHFSDELARFDTVTAMSGTNLKVYPDTAAEDKFIIGKSHTVFSDIPIKQGALHIVDDIATTNRYIIFRYAGRHHL